jgi:hypothetical protein
MNPQEILPSPETESSSEVYNQTESINETESAKQLERKSGPSAGFGAVNAAYVDDAQAQVQGVVGTNLGIASTAATTMLDAPLVAEDLDLIEKEWVRKAKDIVAATLGDPYRQNQKINEMKVDYIKKRYNKDIKIRKE